MNFDRNWTIFALDAEVEAFGTSRIASAHNKLRAEVASLKESIVQFDKTAFDAERARTKAAIEAYKKSLKPVAWGVPNSRITERRPFLSLLHQLPVEGGVDGRRKTPIYPAMLVPLYRLDGGSDE